MKAQVRTIFNLRNPWQQGKGFPLPKKYLERNIAKEIISHLKNDDVLIIYGSRQVGKTTLLYKLMQYLYQKGVSKKDIFYFSADDLTLRSILGSPVDLLGFLLKKQQKKIYLFLDEVQKLDNPGIFLKNLYDYKIPNLKIIATGSSSLEIKSKIIEYLPGRKKVFTLYPLSFSEIKQSQDRKQDLSALWQHYLIFGGYPKVVLANTPAKKKAELKDIYESYIKKDVTGYLNIEKPEKFNQLALLLADQISGLVNIDELTNTLKVNKATVEKYILMLEDTFVVRKVYPFFRNKRTEISKMPKIYFLDQGLRNIILKNFQDIQNRGDSGKLAENFVFTQMAYKQTIDQDLHFWRSKAGAEVDFILQERQNFCLYEVKYKQPLLNIKTRSIRSFEQKYGFVRAFVLSGSKEKTTRDNIQFLPLWEFA